ncbi:MAG: alpha/beta hydrolase fold domain-containing protein [Pseudomonadota bacterium]
MAGSLRKTLVRTALRAVTRPLARADLPLAVQRAALDSAGRTMRKPRGLRIDNTALAGLPARLLTPRDALPARHVLYLHGGAYIEGSTTSHTPLAGQVAAAARARAWLVDYRLAPEHPYPAAVDDAVAAYGALLAQGIDARHIAIVGDSAGGGLALAAALALHDARLPMPAALVLLSPWTDLTLSGRSMQAKEDAEPMLNGPWLDWAAGLYCGGRDDGPVTPRTHPGVSPLFADLSGLPPLLIQAGSEEILLDDSTFLAERARRAGVAVTLHVYDDLWHVFQAQAGLIAEADEALAEIGAFIATHCRAGSA